MRPCPCHSSAIQTASHRITADLSRRGFIAGVTASVASLGLFASAKAAPEPASRPILFYTRAANCREPHLKGLTTMVNSIYNGSRYEDLWLDK